MVRPIISQANQLLTKVTFFPVPLISLIEEKTIATYLVSIKQKWAITKLSAVLSTLAN